MAWVKIDDAMPHHPKVMAAGPQAFALDVAAIAYSNRYLTDGFIADDVLPAVLPSLTQPRKHADKLVRVGRWERCDERGGWDIHDVHEYQPTAEQQREVSRKRSESGKQGGTKSGASRRANAKHGASLGVEANANPGPGPVPVPQGQGQTPPSTDVDQKPHDDRFDEFWNAYPARNGKKLNKPKAREQWRSKVPPDQRDQAIIGARHYAAAYEAGMPGVGAMDAFRWLRDRHWPDWQQPAEPPPNPRDGPKGPPRPPDGDPDYRQGWDNP